MLPNIAIPYGRSRKHGYIQYNRGTIEYEKIIDTHKYIINNERPEFPSSVSWRSSCPILTDLIHPCRLLFGFPVWQITEFKMAASPLIYLIMVTALIYLNRDTSQTRPSDPKLDYYIYLYINKYIQIVDKLYPEIEKFVFIPEIPICLLKIKPGDLGEFLLIFVLLLWSVLSNMLTTSLILGFSSFLRSWRTDASRFV